MISVSLRIGPYARAIGAQSSHSCPISYWACMRGLGIYEPSGRDHSHLEPGPNPCRLLQERRSGGDE
jgi:hypothetical protein